MHTKRLSYFKSTILITLLVSSTTKVLFAESLNYDYAIKWAREGKIEQALKILNRLHFEHPQNQNLLYDYITVLGWAKRDVDALQLARNINFDISPMYVLQNVAKSARNSKNLKQAVKLYIKGAKRFPNNADFYLGLALTLNDMKRIKLSNRVFNKAKEKFPDDANIKFTQAEIYETHKNFFDAMTIYQKLLKKPRYHDKAVYKLVGTLRRLGMPFAAQKYVDKNPTLFDNATKVSLQSDQATFKLRWGTEGYHKEGDNSDVIEALKKIDKVIYALIGKNSDLSNNKRLQNAYFDKIIALKSLNRPKELLNLYRNLKKHNVNIPAYVLNTVGSIYLFEKKPAIAKKLFLQSLRKNPKNFKTKILLFNAYSDNYDMHEALALANDLDKHQLKKIWDSNHLHKIENPKKSKTTLLRILSYEYSGYMDQAQKELETLLAKAPLSGEYRDTLAKLYYYRGWYDKAQEQYQILINNDPKDFDAKAGQFLTTIQQGNYKSAHQMLQSLALQYPHKKIQIQELTKRWNQHKKSTFSLQSSYGKSPSESNKDSSNTYDVSANYYTSPIYYNWRPFIFTKFSHTEFFKKTLNNERYGLGLEYKDQTIDVTTKLGYNATEIKEVAPSVDVTWHTNDTLSFTGGYAYFCEDSPLRGIMYGIRADSFYAGIDYRASESSSASLSYKRMDFTDTNKRDMLNLSYLQRLINGPYYNLDANIYAGTMQNTIHDSVYYNPKKDAYISIEARNSWNIYNFYAMHVKQILGLEVGTHWEETYGSNMTAAMNLEQQWQLNEDFGFNFAYQRKRSVYDGTTEYANGLFLNLNGRF